MEDDKELVVSDEVKNKKKFLKNSSKVIVGPPSQCSKKKYHRSKQ